MELTKFNIMWTLSHREDTVISPNEYIYVIMLTVIYITHGYVVIVLVYIKCKF